MQIYVVTECCYHTSYLVAKLKDLFEGEAARYGLIVRNKAGLDCDVLTAIHAKLSVKDRSELTSEDLSELKVAYGELSSAEEALIRKHGVPAVHSLSFTAKNYITPDLHSQSLRDLLTQQSKDHELAAAVFLDCILQPWWLDVFQGRIINAHSAILPYVRGMYAIEQDLVRQRDPARLEKVAGATIHYIDTKIDCGQLIATRTLPNVWVYDSIWELKAESYMTAFDLLDGYVRRESAFGLTDTQAWGKEFSEYLYYARNFTPVVQSAAERIYAALRAEHTMQSVMSCAGAASFFATVNRTALTAALVPEIHYLSITSEPKILPRYVLIDAVVKVPLGWRDLELRARVGGGFGEYECVGIPRSGTQRWEEEVMVCKRANTLRIPISNKEEYVRFLTMLENFKVYSTDGYHDGKEFHRSLPSRTIMIS